MRNFTFLTAEGQVAAAKLFRQAFMGQTATWSVRVHTVESDEEVFAALQEKGHAYAVSPQYRRCLYEEGHVRGASAALARGADVLYRGGSETIAISQLARCAVDAMESEFLPLYGARVVVVGGGSEALDMVYECSRAGVEEVVLLGADKDAARDSLTRFLGEFARKRTQILDTEQAREGHVSATRAYDATEFLYGSMNSLARIEAADIVIGMAPASQLGNACVWPLRAEQIVCDAWGGPSSPLIQRADACGCDILASGAVMRAWGVECARLLTEFCSADL